MLSSVILVLGDMMEEIYLWAVTCPFDFLYFLCVCVCVGAKISLNSSKGPPLPYERMHYRLQLIRILYSRYTTSLFLRSTCCTNMSLLILFFCELERCVLFRNKIKPNSYLNNFSSVGNREYIRCVHPTRIMGS